jgi:transposase InsO family protein
MKTFSSSPLTAADVLQTGYWFSHAAEQFEILAWDSQKPLVVEARSANNGAVHQFTLLELFGAQAITRFATNRKDLESELEISGQSDLRYGADATTLPERLLKRADRIIQIVEAVQAQIEQIKRQYCLAAKPFSLADITRQACQSIASPVSRSSYYAYHRLCRLHCGDRALIAAALHRKTFGKTRIDSNAQHFVDTVIRRFYRSNPPLRAQTVYNIAQQIWQHNRRWWLDLGHAAGRDFDDLVERLLDGRKAIDGLLSDPEQIQRLTQIRLPSRSWFYGYVSWFNTQPGEGEKTYVLRHGQADWEANFMLFDRFAQTAVLPLQHVFADHCLLDVLHVDDEFREVIGRLWLTVLIDAFSRAVLGIYLTYEAPCIESIQGALHHAIWPKLGLDKYGIDLPWSCYGIPQRLSLDNAWAHHSYSLEDLTRALAGGGRYTRMELVFRPPYQARYGALVERLFGNLSGQIRELLPGAILQPDKRHWHNANQAACLLYRDILRIVHQLIVDYLHTPHRELDGMTPHQKWLYGLELMTPLPPPLTPQMERSFWRLNPEMRIATREGLALFGLHYWDVGLAGLRGRDRQGCQRRYHLRYDPSDVSRVAVFENGIWLGDGCARELRLADGTYESVSLWELELAKDLIRQRDPQHRLRPHSWLVHILEARELIEQRQTEQKLIRRKLQQLQERRPGRPRKGSTAPPLGAEQIVQAEQLMAEMQSKDADPRTRLLETLGEVL